MMSKTQDLKGGPQELITIGPDAQMIQAWSEAQLSPWIVRVMPDGALDKYYEYPIKVEPLTSPVLLPLGAQKRLKMFKDAPEVITTVEDWWIVHEIVPPPKPWLTDDQKRVLKDGTWTTLKILGMVALAALYVGALFLGIVAAVVGSMSWSLCGSDPALLARVKNGAGGYDFVEVYVWYEN